MFAYDLALLSATGMDVEFDFIFRTVCRESVWNINEQGSCRCFANWTSKFIRLPRCSRKTMVASKRHEELYWFRPESYIQSQR